MRTKKIRTGSWKKAFQEVGSIYNNARKSDKFVATFLIGIVFFSSLGIWIDIIQQLSSGDPSVMITADANTTKTDESMIFMSAMKIDNFMTFIIAFISIIIIDSFLEPEKVKDELKGLGILFIGLTIIITFITFYFNSKWIILAYFLCLLIYIAIEAEQDKYDSDGDKNPIGYENFEELKDEE